MIDLSNPFRLVILTISFILGILLVIQLTRLYTLKKIKSMSQLVIALVFFTLTPLATVLHQFTGNEHLHVVAYSCHIFGTLALYFFKHKLFDVYRNLTLFVVIILGWVLVLLHIYGIEWAIFIQIPFSFYIYIRIYQRCAITRKLTTENQILINANLKNIQCSMVFLSIATACIIGAEIIQQTIGNALYLYTIFDTIGWACSPIFAYYAYRAYIPPNKFEKQSPLLQIHDLSVLNTELQRMMEEQRISEQELRERIVELRNINQMRSEFFASFSHELRTPLNGIIGFTELLIDNQIDTITDTQRDILSDVCVSGKHLLTIIEN